MTPTRVTVVLRDDEAEALEALTADGRTRTEVVHRAINVLKFIEDARDSGGRILHQRPDGSTTELVWP